MKKYVSYIGSNICNILLHLFYIFPIKKNRILFISYFGRKYSCNPRYISEYLEKNYPEKFEIIWMFRNPNNFRELEDRGIKICKYRSIQYYFYRLTAGIVVHNSLIGAEAPIRKKQMYIQTWHGSGAYKSNVKRRDTLYERLVDNRIRRTFQKNSYVMASCEVGKKNTFVDAMGYHGRYVNGMPRIDVLIHQNQPDICHICRKTLNIPEDKKILLYAPTWRNDCKMSDFDLAYEEVIRALEQRFGETWVILRRMHHYSTSGKMGLPKGVIDVTSYPEMQELLLTSDAVISDYSSTLWDFSFTKKPCFQYCVDLDEYQKNRGITTNIYEWGFPLAKTNKELVEKILTFDEKEFAKNMEAHHKHFGALESGNATKEICEIIEQYAL